MMNPNGNDCCGGTECTTTTRTADNVYRPGVDVIESAAGADLYLDMPGVGPEGVEISYERGLLTISGRPTVSQHTGNSWIAREYGVGEYRREFRVGEGVDANRIEAKIEQGVLHVALPKAQELMPRRIAVKSA